MLPEMIRANRGVDSLFGGVSVREFAACEFPHEDIAWVASQVRPKRLPKEGARARWGRFWRPSGTPGETESNSEALSEPASA